MDTVRCPAALLWHPTAILRESLVAWMAREFPQATVAAPVAAADAVAVVDTVAFRLALLDVDARPRDAIRIMAALRKHQPEARRIALTVYPANVVCEGALAGGAHECVCISAADPGLARRVRTALEATTGPAAAIRRNASGDRA